VYYEDYYDEPSEFEQQIEEFKQSLVNAVAKEHQDEMKRLREENEKLKEFRDKMQKMEREHQKAVSELELEKTHAQRVAVNTRLRDLLKPVYQGAWKVKASSEYEPKCDKCEESEYGRRFVHYHSPQGKPCQEQCDCYKRVNRYETVRVNVVSFGEDDYKKGNVNYYLAEVDYKGRKCHDDKENSWCHYTQVYDGCDFESIKRWYEELFLDEADAEKFCRWLEAKAED